MTTTGDELREQVRATMLHGRVPRSYSRPQLELLTTIISWGIYGAAMEGSQRSGEQSAESFVEEARSSSEIVR